MDELPADARSTCWGMIEQASAGSESERERFATRYLEVVRTYLLRRWSGSGMLGELDDAVQEVFVECFRQGGVLDRVSESPPDSFRAFLYGVTRNVARRWEKRVGRQRERQPAVDLDPERLDAEEATLSRVFDRAWARALFRRAGELQRQKAKTSGERAERRVEILELRSRDGLPIREIARGWGLDTALLHKEYARARREFRAALIEVLSFDYPHLSAAELECKCLELLELLKG